MEENSLMSLSTQFQATLPTVALAVSEAVRLYLSGLVIDFLRFNDYTDLISFWPTNLCRMREEVRYQQRWVRNGTLPLLPYPLSHDLSKIGTSF